MDDFQKTIDSYERLGEKYIQNTADLSPEDYSGFISLLPKGGRVLDAGCAGGRDSMRFAEDGFKAVGIDLVDSFLNYCREHIPKGEFRKTDVRSLNFPRESFDGIWASMVLLHLKRAETSRVLEQFGQILKPGGVIFIGVKSGTGEAFVPDKLADGLGRFFTFFTLEEIKSMVEQSGFEVRYAIEEDDNARRGIQIIRLMAQKK